MPLQTAENPVSLADAERLATYLRAHPEATNWPAHELAAQFMLPVPFVNSVLSSLGARKMQRSAPILPLDHIRTLIFGARVFFRRLTADPLTFVAISTVVAGVTYLLIYFSLFHESGRESIPEDPLGIQRNPAAFFVISSVTMLLHYACYFRHGKLRFALQGSVFVWMMVSATATVILWVRGGAGQGFETLVIIALFTLIALILTGFYALLASSAAIFGGAFWVTKSLRAKAGRSRQELLAHLFDLQDRLKSPLLDSANTEPSTWQFWLGRVRRDVLKWGIGSGIAMSAVLVLVSFAFVQATSLAAYDQNPLYVLSIMAWYFVRVAAMAILAYCGRTPGRALTALILFEIGWRLLLPLPIPPFGPTGNAFRETLSPTSMIWSTLTMALTFLLGIASAGVEQRHIRERRLHENDKATLLAEIVQTEWQLALQTRTVCVVVVDVARSSRMKTNADPLAVEFSFREYQSYVAEICSVFGGTIHSTAGDGAILIFADCPTAFEASRQIQTGMRDFNAFRNRLETPFHVRIGLHAGEVAGDLNDIQFAEVIDIAAHVEATAPVDGIAVTQPVAEHLPGARLALMPNKLGGLSVYFSAEESAE